MKRQYWLILGGIALVVIFILVFRRIGSVFNHRGTGMTEEQLRELINAQMAQNREDFETEAATLDVGPGSYLPANKEYVLSDRDENIFRMKRVLQLLIDGNRGFIATDGSKPFFKGAKYSSNLRGQEDPRLYDEHLDKALRELFGWTKITPARYELVRSGQILDAL